MRNLVIFFVAILVSYSSTASAGTCDYDTSSCSGTNPWLADSANYNDVSYCVNNCVSAGETVYVPGGNELWSFPLLLNKSINFIGAGIGSTNITIDGNDYRGVVVVTASNVLVKGFTFTQRDDSKPYMIQATTGGDNFRITGCKFAGTTGYAIDVRGVYGLIDNNIIEFTTGTSQPINVWGPSNSWTTPNSIGTADNVFIEDNNLTFANRGYLVCSTDARCVVRHNTFNSPAKSVDMHGRCTGGVRHYEIYNNTFGDVGGYINAIELRGGSGRVFDNVSTKTEGAAWLFLDEHAANHTYCTGYSPSCCTEPPCDGQIGVGLANTRASLPLFTWGNSQNGSSWVPFVQWDEGACSNIPGQDMAKFIVAGTDYYNSVSKPDVLADYTPYTYPHPLRKVLVPEGFISGTDGN